MPPARQRPAKSYAFTLNNYTEANVAFFEEFEHPKLTHLYVAKEVAPTTGTPHLQGYVCFSKTFRITGLHTLSRDHFRPCAFFPSEGSPEQNRNYCFKGEQPKEEWEELKEKGPNWGKNVQKVRDFGNPQQGGRSDIASLRDAVFAGATYAQLMLNHLPALSKYSKFYEKCRAEYLKQREFPTDPLTGAQLPSRKRDVTVEIHWGVPGAGKSHLAHVAGAIKLDLASKGWFDGYDDEQVVVLEEFDWQLFDIDFMKGLLDVYPRLLNVKGKSAYANWTKVFITANNDPEQWWPGASEVDRAAFLSRVTEIHHYPEESVHNARRPFKKFKHGANGDVTQTGGPVGPVARDDGEEPPSPSATEAREQEEELSGDELLAQLMN